MSDVKAPKTNRQQRRAAERDETKGYDIIREVGDTVRRNRQQIAAVLERCAANRDITIDGYIVAAVHPAANLLPVFDSKPGIYPVKREELAARLLGLVSDEMTRDHRRGLEGLHDAVSTPLACGHMAMFMAMNRGSQVCCPICDYDVMTKTEN